MKRAFTILFLLLLATTAHGQSITQLFAFACSPYPSCPDGTKPDSVIQASDGNLYGTTAGPAAEAFSRSPKQERSPCCIRSRRTPGPDFMIRATTQRRSPKAPTGFSTE